ncbi:MAG: right-handed parallel beta-helix repeat-containing protein [Promethearchaeota archaeon]
MMKKQRFFYLLTSIIIFSMGIMGIIGGEYAYVINEHHNYDDPLRDITSLDSAASSSPSVMKEIYVSPNGNDSWNGTQEFPFKSLQHTIDFLKEFLENQSQTGDIYVILENGTYFLDKPLTLNSSISGKNGYKVLFKSDYRDSAIISAGIEVDNWSLYENRANYSVWKIDLGAMIDSGVVPNITDFRQFYINGNRRVRARGPADFVISSDDEGHKLSDDSIKNWRNLKDVEFVYRDIWTLPRVHVDHFDPNTKILYMQQPAYYLGRSKSPFHHINDPEWVENAFELLDTPGEWYFDKPARILYYIPYINENSSMRSGAIKAEIPFVENPIIINGSETNPVSNINFVNISFQYGSWLYPNEHNTSFVESQANVYITLEKNDSQSDNSDFHKLKKVYNMSPGMVTTNYAVNIAFENCSFYHSGVGALNLGIGTQYSRIEGCVFKDNSGIAIQIGEIYHPNYNETNPGVVKNIEIKNNYIVNSSLEYMAGPGIFTGYVRNVVISHNTISNLPYTGISVGWGWSPKETICANNSIVYNRIYGIMNFLIDGGGIYTLSTQPGTNVSYNVIHDSGWNGLYPDERTNGTTWAYNVVFNCYNSFLDHSMYEEPYWNNVYMNFLDTYPKTSSCWYQSRDKDQIWYPYTNYESLRNKIINSSGVEKPYQNLIPENESYYHFIPYPEYLEVSFTAFPIIFSVIAIIALVMLNKKRVVAG